MISVPIWSNGQMAVILLSLFATVALVISGPLIALVAPLRRSIGRRPKLQVGLVVAFPLLLIASLPTLVLVIAGIGASRSVNAPESERHVTLERARTIDTFDMPVGTRLDLIAAYELSSFKHAEFPHPVKIFGVTAMAMNSVLPYSIGLTGTGEQVVDGWTCNATGEIKFSRRDDQNHNLDVDSPFHFSGCILGRGNRIAGNVVIPEHVRLSESMLDKSALNIRVVKPLPIGPGGALLERSCLTINRDSRTLTHIDDARLVRPLKWKNVVWPAGTQVDWYPPSQETQPAEEPWRFSKPSLLPSGTSDDNGNTWLV